MCCMISVRVLLYFTSISFIVDKDLLEKVIEHTKLLDAEPKVSIHVFYIVNTVLQPDNCNQLLLRYRLSLESAFHAYTLNLLGTSPLVPYRPSLTTINLHKMTTTT